MDDAGGLEVDLDERIHQGAEAYEENTCRLFGRDAVHEGKKRIEGAPSTIGAWWGWLMDVQNLALTLPPEKLRLMVILVFNPTWDWGCERIPRKEAQSLRGHGEFWRGAAPALQTELASFDSALSGEADDPWVNPRGSPEERQDKLERLWYTVEQIRILAADEEKWGHRFSSSFASVLRPEQRANLPGQAGRVSWMNGDATPDTSSSLEYQDKVFVRADLQDGLYQALRARLPGLPEDVVIGCGELMQYVCHACTRGRHWGGRMNWLGTDNMNTKDWIKWRYSQVPEIQYLLRVLGIVEAMYDFSTTAFYTRTYHNDLADGLTREDWSEVVSALKAEGWVQVSIDEAWKYFLEEVDRHHIARLGALVPFGAGEKDMRIARQLAEQRGGRGIPRGPDVTRHRGIELFSSTGSFIKLWAGGERLVLPVNPQAGRALSLGNPEIQVVSEKEVHTGGGSRTIFYSGGGAKGREELGAVRKLVWDQATTAFLLDLPAGETGEIRVLKGIPSKGWDVKRLLVNAADRGDGQRRWRVLWAGKRGEPGRWTCFRHLSERDLPLRVPPGKMRDCLEPPEGVHRTEVEAAAIRHEGPEFGYDYSEVRRPSQQIGDPVRVGKVVVRDKAPGARVRKRDTAEYGVVWSRGVGADRGLVVPEGGGHPEWADLSQWEHQRSEVPVHSPDGPAGSIGGPDHPLLGHSGGLVLGATGPRRLLPRELWRLQGGGDREWEALNEGIVHSPLRVSGPTREALLRGVPKGLAATGISLLQHEGAPEPVPREKGEKMPTHSVEPDVLGAGHSKWGAGRLLQGWIGGQGLLQIEYTKSGRIGWVPQHRVIPYRAELEGQPHRLTREGRQIPQEEEVEEDGSLRGAGPRSGVSAGHPEIGSHAIGLVMSRNEHGIWGAWVDQTTVGEPRCTVGREEVLLAGESGEKEAGRHAAQRWAEEELGIHCPAAGWDLFHVEQPHRWAGEEILVWALPPGFEAQWEDDRRLKWLPLTDLPERIALRADFTREERRREEEGRKKGCAPVRFDQRGGGNPKSKAKGPRGASPKGRPRASSNPREKAHHPHGYETGVADDVIAGAATRRSRSEPKRAADKPKAQRKAERQPEARAKAKASTPAQSLSFPPPVPGSDLNEWNRQARRHMVRGAQAEGTQTGRDIAWKQWVQHRGSKSPFLTWNSDEERVRAEDSVLDWVSQLAFVLKRRPGTVKGKIGHIGEYHVEEKSVVNPLDSMPRVRKALRFLKRMPGGVRRKFPAGPPLLRHVRFRARAWSAQNRIVLRAVLSTGFCFLLRCSEYLSRGRAGWDLGKVLRGADVVFRRDGKTLHPSEIFLANEVAIFLRSSKADQFNCGQLLVHHLADEDQADLCVVRALRDLCILFPERLVGEKEQPLMRCADGEPVSREILRKLLGDAAEDQGIPRANTGTHSLRVAGATAIYAATDGNKDMVQRLGRWSSDCFQGYLWEDRTLTCGLATKMLRAPWSPHMGAF